ncbi:MAG: UxaA family hydrolase, partial [Burkholderiaceae bacterium]
ATVAHAIAAHFSRMHRPEVLKNFPAVDGVVAITHGTGCGMDVQGQGMRVLQRTLAGYARHANFAAVLVVGLGCEGNQVAAWLENSHLTEADSLRTFNIQDSGGTSATVAAGIELIQQLLPKAQQVRRTPCDVAHLTLGLQCGGSDGYSGVSANPALGVAADRLVAHGATVVLSETPEIYGAEHLLTRRAVNAEVGNRLLERIRWWEQYTAMHGGEMDNNPSPGNKAGGLTSSNLQAVHEYAEALHTKGLVFMDTPGYDPVSVTGQVAGGANLVAFTTGRGSAYGCAPAPSLKLATNRALAQRQADDIDIDCGGIVLGECSVAEMGEHIFQTLLRTASGVQTRREHHGYGQNEFVPWQLGAVM